MNTIFTIVFEILNWLSNISGFTYKEINIIVYYVIAPFVYLYFIDKIIGKNYLKIAFVTTTVTSLLIIDDFGVFSNYLFDKSVVFLKSFGFLGWNYVVASVMICVFLPLVVLLALFLVKRRFRKT